MDDGRPSNKPPAGIVGARVDAGTLPLAGNGRIVAARGGAHACSACADPIAPTDLALEIGTTLRVHLECFRAWSLSARAAEVRRLIVPQSRAATCVAGVVRRAVRVEPRRV